MEFEIILKKLNDIFIDVFDDENIKIDLNTYFTSLKDWDSLNHITLVSVIESEFNVSFNIEDIPKLKNVNIIINQIMEKLK